MVQETFHLNGGLPVFQGNEGRLEGNRAAGLLFRDVAPSMSMHVLMGAYFAHLLARTVYLSVRYRKDILNFG